MTPSSPELLALASFAEHVRSAGDRPAPAPSIELQALVAAHARAVTRADRARRVIPPSLVGSSARVSPPAPHVDRLQGGRPRHRRQGRPRGVDRHRRRGRGRRHRRPPRPGRRGRARRHRSRHAPRPAERGFPGRRPGPGGPSPAPAPAATGTDAPPSSAAGGGPSAGERPPAGDAQGGNDAPEGGDGPAGGNGAAGGDRGAGPAADGNGADGSPGGDANSGGPGDEDLDRDGDDRTRFRGERWYDPAGLGQDTPAPASGDSPDAAGDEGTDPGVARDADAAGSTG